MRYTNIDNLDKAIERIISRTVKHYYTDWKNYDRPKYMSCKASGLKEDKELILIARECGTYLVKIADAESGNDWANTLLEYYKTSEHASYYYINIDKLDCKQIDPSTIKTNKAA